MAAEAPSSVDVTDYQFKVHDKLQVFGSRSELNSNVNLLATASPFGLIFLGNQYKAEIKVIQLEKFVDAKETGEQVLARVAPLPGIPHNLTISCDGALLAINYTQNGAALLSIYDTQSFLTPNIVAKQTLRISADNNVRALQILWNPVIASTFAVVLSDGSLSTYTLKDAAFEFHSLDKQEQAKCACWSPKGKQIVVGFPHGRLTQYKPDLKPARTIACPPNIHEEPFATIAIQWLSTYQFAVVFLQQGDDLSPSLYIVNAPKNAQPTYINYYDICYSASGPRDAQIFLTYVQQWNILLMASSNSMEVGILGTTETGDFPTWKQYITPDEARIELPLTSEKQETHPVGFAFDTGTTHQLVIAERQFPVMPMIHMLSTHGMFISFNFLNFSPNAPSLCSPPRPISNPAVQSLFQPIDIGGGNSSVPAVTSQSRQLAHPATEVSFALPNGATSTPAPEKKSAPLFGGPNTAGSLFSNFGSTGTSPLFGSAPSSNPSAVGGQPSTGSMTAAPPIFGGGQSLGQKPTTASPPQFGGKPLFGNSTFGQTIGGSAVDTKSMAFGASKDNSKAAEASKPATIAVQDSAQGKSQPLYTVPPSFTTTGQKVSTKKDLAATSISGTTDEQALKELTKAYIQQFEADLKDLSKRSKEIDITIGNMDESKEVVNQLNKLEELSNQAVESTESLASDIQALRNSLNECFVMIAETKSKLNMFQNPKLPELATLSNSNQTNRRQINKLKSLLATNEAQMQIVNQQIDAQWSNYQDMYRKSKTKMRIPSLEGVYQTLLKQKDIVVRERLKINYIRSRLGLKGTIPDPQSTKKDDVTIESLADSILSMSLSEQVKSDRAGLTEEKLTNLRNILQNRKIVEIKPHRPERLGVKSDIVREMRVKMDKANQRDGASTKPEKMEKQRIKYEVSQTIAKPTPTKPVAASIATPSFAAITQKEKTIEKLQPPAPPLAFNTNIVKPTATTQPNKESTFAPMSTPSTGGISFGGAFPVQKTPSFTPAVPFSASALAIPTPLGAASASGAQAFAFVGAKDDKPLVKTVPAMTPLHQSNIENIAKNLPPNITIQAKPSFGGFGTSGDAKAPFFGSKAESAPAVAAETAASRPQISITVETKSDVKKKSDEKPIAPFGGVSFGQSTGFGTSGFVFGSKSSTSSTIFGSESDPTTIPAPSIFSSQEVQPSPAPSSTAASSTAATQANNSSAVTTSASPELAFSFLSKPSSDASSVSSSTTPTISFGAKSEPASNTTSVNPAPAAVGPTSETVASTMTNTGYGFNFGSTTSSSSMSSFSFAALAKNFTTTSTTTPSVTSTTAATTAISAPSSVDPTDSLFDNLNICKPTALEDAPPSSMASPFSGSVFGASSFATSPEINKVSTPLISSLNLPSSAASSTTSATVVETPVSSVQASSTNTPDASTPLNLNVASTPNSFEAPVNLTVSSASTTLFGAQPISVSTSAAPAFGAPTTVSTSVAPAFGAPTTVSTSAAPAFGAATTAASTAPSMFTSQTAASTPSALFGAQSTTTSAFSTPQSVAAATPPSTLGSGSAASTFSFASASANVFGGGMPKPEQSVFGGAAVTSTAATTPFGGGNAQGTNLFSSPGGQPASGGNLFGSSGGTIGFGAQPTSTGGSIFGGGSPAQQTSLFGGATNTTSSIFGGQKTESANVFGSPPQQSQASASSFFGQASFGGDNNQSSGSIFGGGTTSPIQPGAFSSAPAFSQTSFGGAQQQQQASSPFSGGGVAPAFGGGGSGFGGGSAFSQSPGFGNTSGGSFVQGGQSSVAQSGFGSPGGFTTPAFGGAQTFGNPPTFGSPPTFGGAPTFGGSATFGSPKSTFGGFGAQNTPAFSPPTQKSTLFESLGSSEQALSFGNLAQTNNNPANKPQFGGTSFSTWR